LADLEALDRHGAITPLGRQMLAFPMHPRYSRMLLAAQAGRCVRQAALIAALTQGRDLLIRNPGRDVEALREDAFGGPVTSDFWILMRAWEYAVKNQFRPEACRKAGVHALAARQVGPLLDHFLQLASDQGLDTRERTVPDEALRQCILTGFSDRVARRPDERSPRCDLVHGRRGALARESAVHSGSLLVAAEIREVQGADGTLTTLLSLATAIEAEWLRDLFPEDMRHALRVYYDPAIKRVCAEEQWLFRELPIATRRVEPAPADQAAQLLAGEVVRGNLALDNWDEQVEQWILRLNRLAEWCPEFELPKIEEESRQMLIEQICHGAFSHKDIKDRDVKSIVKSWLSQAQQDLLDKHAPERFALPNGRKSKIVYSGDGQPYLATRLADLFDLKATPRIAMNRVPVLLHILAPNMRPVQITQDLAGFWKDHYPRIKQELQRKYPRHEWR
jgi:ATP-dependent helicase HrpB